MKKWEASLIENSSGELKKIRIESDDPNIELRPLEESGEYEIIGCERITSIISVSVFMIDQSYGGPEEGGRWYQTGYPDCDYERFTRLFRSESRARHYAQRLEYHLIRHLNKGRPSISSVLSQGRYEALVCDGMPKAFPEERPYYE